MKKTNAQNSSLSLKSDSIYYHIYGGVMLWLLPGLLRVSRAQDIAQYLLYVACFSLASYLLLQKSLPIGGKFLVQIRPPKTLKNLIIVTALIFPILHWMRLGEVPLLQAFGTSDYLEIVLMRQRITEYVGTIWLYGSSLNVLSALPFLVLLALVKCSKWFWFLAIFALCYAASLLQKSYVIVVFLPAATYALQNRNFGLAATLGLLSGLAVATLIFATNPSLRPKLNIIPDASAATAKTTPNNVPHENWIAYAVPFAIDTPGKFSNGAFYFTGKNAVFLNREGTRWNVGLDDFSLDFWVFPLIQPPPGEAATLYWNGSENDYRGAVHILHGTYSNGAPYLAFATHDKSGKFTVSTASKGELRINQWNHISAARKGGTLSLGLNGAMIWSSGGVADLTLPQNSKGIVQFGAQFGNENRELINRFFNGYIDEIVFSKGSVKYFSNYSVPAHPELVRALTISDVSEFQSVPRVAELPPNWLPNFFPAWLNGMIHRVIFVPGEVVGQWFSVVPTEIPFAYGCAYRPLAILLNCSHVNFSKLVYTSYNRSLEEKGVSGTMNAASFMEDYANFGLPGMLGGAILLALILYFLGIVFSSQRRIGIALNIAPLLYLSSSALLPLLFSGGWLVTILLYMIFYEEIDNSLKDSSCAV